MGPGAAAFVSTQASTKVYRSPRGTSAELRARVGPDGLLIVAPDPVVCFAGARYRQAQRFQRRGQRSSGRHRLRVVRPARGRRAMGVRRVRSLIEISRGDRLLVHDALALRAPMAIWPSDSAGSMCWRWWWSPGGRCAARRRASSRRRPDTAVARRADQLIIGVAGRRGRLHSSRRGHVGRAGRPHASRAACDSFRRGSATIRGGENGERMSRFMHLTPREIDKLVLHQAGCPGAEAAGARTPAQLRGGHGADRHAAARVHPRRPLRGRAHGPGAPAARPGRRAGRRAPT